MSPDEDLVRDCLAGSPAGQHRFVRLYTPLVWSLCRRAGLPADEAEDVCQEVFVAAFAALPRYRGLCKLSTWLYTLARRRLVDFRRSPLRRHHPSGAAADASFPHPPPADPAPTPEADATRAQQRRRVREAVDILDEPVRSILVAYYLGEVPVLEIARTMGLAEGTVKTHLHRGRQRLRESLRDLC